MRRPAANRESPQRTNRGPRRRTFTPFETHVRAVGFARAEVVCRPVEKSDVVVALRPGRTIQKGWCARVTVNCSGGERKTDGENVARASEEVAEEVGKPCRHGTPCRRRRCSRRFVVPRGPSGPVSRKWQSVHRSRRPSGRPATRRHPC